MCRLYLCHSELENSIVPGKYSKLGVAKQSEPPHGSDWLPPPTRSLTLPFNDAAHLLLIMILSHGPRLRRHHGERASGHRFREKMEHAFEAIERDFKAFDQSGAQP
eukprot:2101520-Rhodomonas_salina.1